MTVAATAVWRVRPSGSNLNGGGFDASISSATGSLGVSVTGSHGSWATSAGTTTFTDATAAAFIAGMATAPGTSINISGVGQFLILSYVGTTQITIQTPLGAPNSGGALYNWTIGSGLDYSQQNSAQASGTHGTAVGTTDFQDTVAANFTSAMVGNALYITGTGLTTGFYFCVAFISSSDITLDRSPGTGTIGTWHLGGGWADFWTNTTSALAYVVAGNIIYILGGASPSYGSPDYAPGSFYTIAAGSSTTGLVEIIGDPGTSSTNGYGGYPLIKTTGLLFYNGGPWAFLALFLFASNNSFGSSGVFNPSSATYLENIIFDQNGYDVTLRSVLGNVTGCEVFSSVGKRGTNAQYGIGTTTGFGQEIIGCNIHDCIGPGVNLAGTDILRRSIIAKNGGVGINASTSSATLKLIIEENTVDGNAGSALVIATQVTAQGIEVFNNIFSNHTTGGTYAITVSAGSQVANDRVKGLIDYNVLYNNAGNYNAISPGTHDTVLSSNPYVGQSTENYTLA